MRYAGIPGLIDISVFGVLIFLWTYQHYQPKHRFLFGEH